MFIIRHKDQTCYGPFETKEEAIGWSEETFGVVWSRACPKHFVCHYVEPVANKT